MISHIYKDACSLAQAKGLPSLIYHEPMLEVRFVRGAAGPTSFLTKRALAPAALMAQLVNLRSVGVRLRTAESQGRRFIQVCTGVIYFDLLRNDACDEVTNHTR